MTGNKVNYVMVGSFVLAMLAALIFSIALLSGRTGATDNYYTIYNNVSGIDFGTKVLFEGYHVGQVEEVTPVVEDGAMRFRVDMSVIEGWQIPVDSVARKEAGGILAAVTIAIRAGESKEMLEPDGMILAGASANLFDAMSDMAAEAGDMTRTGLKPLLENMNRQVDALGVLLEKDIPDILAEMSVTASVAAEKSPAIVANLEEFSEGLVASGRRLETLMSDKNVAAVESALANAERGARGLAELVEELKATNADLGATASAAAEKAPAIVANLEELSQGLIVNNQRLEVLLRESGEGIGKILSDENAANFETALANVARGTQGFPELIDNFKAASTDLNAMVREMNALIAGNKGDIDGTVDDLKYSMQTVARHIDAILRNLEGSSRHMYEFSRQIRLNPGLLLGGSPPRDEAAAPSLRRPAGESR